MDDSCEPGGKLCRGGSDSIRPYCSLKVLTGGVIKVVVNHLPGCATLLWMHPGAGPIVQQPTLRGQRGGSGGVLYPFQLVIFDHLRPTCPTDAHMHMHTVSRMCIIDERLRFIPRPREHAAAHRRSTRTRSCSAAAGCPAAAANGRTPTGTVERPLRGLCRRAVII